MSIWRAEDGRVRSGWVVLVFGVLTVAAGFGLSLVAVIIGAVVLKLQGLTISVETLMPGHGADSWNMLIASWPTLGAAVVASLVCHRVFKEQVGLKRQRAGAFVGLGLGLGLLALTLAVVVPAVVGVGTLQLTTLPALAVLGGAVTHLLVLSPQSVAEELLMRGVPLRALSRGTHPVAAAVLTSSVFGVVHANNPGASWVAIANVALVGLWFAALTFKTGTLWCSIGLHVAWNFCEGVVFGQPVSGLAPGRTLFTATWPHAASFWSGGDFGPEASGWTTVLLVAATVVTVLWPTSRAPAAVPEAASVPSS